MSEPIKVLTFSTLYPNRETPYHGIFVENRLLHLLRGGEVAALVIAPVPWFPWQSQAFGRYAAFARVPREEERHGITILHPRYLLMPKIGMTMAPYLMYRSLSTYIDDILRGHFPFEMIDAHYLYPDGVAAALLGRRLGKPVVITARGTDVNLIPRYRPAKRWIRWAADQAAAIVAVSEALRSRLIDLGIPGGRIATLRNGVDLDLFAPCDRQVARRQLGVNVAGMVLASIGSLIPTKGHEVAIRATASLPKVTLVIAGEGPQDAALRRLAERLGVADRVRFIGAVPQERLVTVYNAAEIVVLASSREGFPNVLLEALACGTPVVATDVGGAPEIVAAAVAGRLVAECSPEALCHAIRGLLSDPPAREAVRAYAERFGWGPTTAGQIRMFRSILASAA